jgi:hypothetical protein
MNVPQNKTHHPLRENLRLARQLLGGTLPTRVAKSLETLSKDFHFSLSNGELQFINSWGASMLRPSILFAIQRPTALS